MGNLPWSSTRAEPQRLLAMSYECPCEVIVPGWTNTQIEQKGYSVWLWPNRRCRALAVGFPTSPEIQTLALRSSTEIILIHIGPCPALEPSVQAIGASTPRQAGSSWHTGTRTPHGTQIYPVLCVMVVFMPGPKVVIPREEDEYGDPHQWTTSITGMAGRRRLSAERRPCRSSSSRVRGRGRTSSNSSM